MAQEVWGVRVEWCHQENGEEWGFDRENGEELGVQVEQCYQENGEEWEYQPGEW